MYRMLRKLPIIKGLISSLTSRGITTQFEPVIGLEIHAQILSSSKAFSSAETSFAAPPNSKVSFWDASIPGTLPLLNERCVEAGVKTALCLGMTINAVSYFDRKHYFYADLPNGYQITQFRKPIAESGSLSLSLTEAKGRSVAIQRVQLEHDSGKSLHTAQFATLIDLNRAGTGLMEIITEPDIYSARDAAEFVRQLLSILRTIGTCDEGSLRVDANISLRNKGSQKLGTRTEVKNINGLRHLIKAIEYEIERQTEILSKGGVVEQETRAFDAALEKTVRLRNKSGEVDYRFLPEPDLPPLVIEDQYIDKLRADLPELPMQSARRLIEAFGLSESSALTIVLEPGALAFFDRCSEGKSRGFAGKAASWITTELFSEIHERGISIENSPISSVQLSDLVMSIESGSINGKIAKEIFARMVTGDHRLPSQIAVAENLMQTTNEADIVRYCETVLDQHQDKVKQYLGGKSGLLGFFVAQVLKISGGKANPSLVNTLLIDRLKQRA